MEAGSCSAMSLHINRPAVRGSTWVLLRWFSEPLQRMSWVPDLGLSAEASKNEEGKTYALEVLKI